MVTSLLSLCQVDVIINGHVWHGHITAIVVCQVGAATAVGEQPIKGLVDACCGARMTVAEAVLNLVFARVSSLEVSSLDVHVYYYYYY